MRAAPMMMMMATIAAVIAISAYCDSSFASSILFCTSPIAVYRESLLVLGIHSFSEHNVEDDMFGGA